MLAFSRHGQTNLKTGKMYSGLMNFESRGTQMVVSEIYPFSDGCFQYDNATYYNVNSF